MKKYELDRASVIALIGLFLGMISYSGATVLYGLKSSDIWQIATSHCFGIAIGIVIVCASQNLLPKFVKYYGYVFIILCLASLAYGLVRLYTGAQFCE